MMWSPPCPLCGASADELALVSDHFFGSPGTWHYWHCPEPNCGVAFPAPAPTDQELVAAYSSYYTHGDSGGTSLPGWAEARLTGVSSWLRRVPLFGWLGEQIAWELGGVKPRTGLIVDIGSGDGARLGRLRRAGWTRIIGIEPDTAAVNAAKAAGIDVRIGDAETLPLEDGIADAALMHHVIEHVRDPRKALIEACRILKPGGELSVVTPNINSLGQARWGAFWRGFEAPRHLMIFTSTALDALTREAGFEVICNRSSARSAAWVDEISARAAGTPEASAGLVMRILRAESAFRAQNSAGAGEQGEEIVLIARKR